MKKTYTIAVEGKNPARVLDACKHDLRKYAKRERAKPLPQGVDFWDFDCKLGIGSGDAKSVHFSAVIPGIDALVLSGAIHFYVEMTAKHGFRTARPATEPSDQVSP